MLCCLLVATHALAYETRGARPCAGWQQFRADERTGVSVTAQVYETWLVGYLSGLVAGSGTDFLAGTPNETVFLLADQYCAVNPQSNLADAGTYVARWLVDQKNIVVLPTLP